MLADRCVFRPGLCRNGNCAKKTFAEQWRPGLTVRYGRWTSGQVEALRAVARGGRAGARLAGQLGTPVSRMAAS